MGLLGTAGTLGMAAGPAIGGLVSNQLGIQFMFYCSSFFGLISIVILLGIKETLKEKHPLGFALLKIHKRDLFEPRVILPCVIMALCVYAYGVLFTIIPDFGEFLGIRNKGLVFTYFTVASLAVRLLAGKASDRWGRIPVLRVSAFTIALGMLIIAFADSKLILFVGVVLYGLGQGTNSPTLLAWATDLSDPEHRGRGLASLYIFMELGIGVGAFTSGLVYGNDPTHFFTAFILASILSAIAFIYLVFRRSSPGSSASLEAK
jgi:MFS family permease